MCRILDVKKSEKKKTPAKTSRSGPKRYRMRKEVNGKDPEKIGDERIIETLPSALDIDHSSDDSNNYNKAYQDA
jgi:hypothetical protein